jgi:hypothetical protein
MDPFSSYHAGMRPAVVIACVVGVATGCTSKVRPSDAALTVRLAQGERTKIAEGVEVTFIGNSHKIIEAGESPLGVSLTIHRNDQDIEAFEWIDVSNSTRFTAAGVTFEYVACQYDWTIDLVIIAVEPLAP